MRHIIGACAVAFLVTFLVAGCSSTEVSQQNSPPRSSAASRASGVSGAMLPASATPCSFESLDEQASCTGGECGDLESAIEYRVDRDIASSKATELEGKVSPSDPDKYLEYLSLLDSSGKTAEAEKKIKAFLSENPNDKRPVFLLAVHYWRIQKKELASYFFNQLEKEATFPWKSLLYNNLGMIALQEKNRNQALSYFEKATKSSPETAAPFVNLGSLYLQSRSYVPAEAAFTKARSLDDDFEDATLGLAVALEGQGKFEEAHKIYSNYMNQHPNALNMVYNDSVLLGNRLSRKEEAAQQMLRYIQRGGKETARAQEVIQSWR